LNVVFRWHYHDRAVKVPFIKKAQTYGASSTGFVMWEKKDSKKEKK